MDNCLKVNNRLNGLKNTEDLSENISFVHNFGKAQKLQDQTGGQSSSFKELKRNCVFIYNGPGTVLVTQACETFKKFLSSYTIQKISPQEVCAGQWVYQAALFVMPGGTDISYTEQLNGLGNDQIKIFVKNGGTYLGICGGAFYASSTVEFCKGDPSLQVLGERELSFFPGVACGPALPSRHPFSYENEASSQSAHIVWSSEHKTTFLYYKGGCFFQDASSMPGIKVLAHYGYYPENPLLLLNALLGRVKQSSAVFILKSLRKHWIKRILL